MKTQRGTTMIELMISLLLGMALIGGIGELFLQMKENSVLQRSLSHMMEDGAYTLETLSKELRNTGFLRNRYASPTGTAPAASAAVGAASQIFRADTDTLGTSTVGEQINFAQGEVIHGGRSSNTETLAFRYQVNDQADLISAGSQSSRSPCTLNLGFNSPLSSFPNEDPTTTAHVVTVAFYWNGGININCRAKRETITAGATPTLLACVKPGSSCGTASGKSIISNVERVIIKYGVDSDAPATPTPDYIAVPNYYTDQAGIDAGNLWKKIVSVKLYIVLMSEDDKVSKTAGKFSIEGVPCSSTTYPCPTSTNRRVYKVFSTTIAFRNQSGGY